MRDACHLRIFIILTLLPFLSSYVASGEKTLLIPVCDVTSKEFGAVGDNVTEDTAAIQNALNQCSKVILPKHYTFYIRPIQLLSNRHLQLNGNLAAWRNVTTWPNSTNKKCSETGYTSKTKLVQQKESLIWGIQPLNGVIISGNGTVFGDGWRWWPLRNDTKHGEYWHNCRPKLLFLGQNHITKYGSISGVIVNGVTFKDSPFWTVTGRGLSNATFYNVKITTTGCGYSQAPNTDGFNLQGENILVHESSVKNGDDCVPIFPPSRNVLVQNINCSCGNPPVAVVWPASNHRGRNNKSFYAGDIVNVTFDHINLFGTSSGLAIKSLSPFVGTAKNIQFTNIVMKGVQIGMAINFFHQGLVSQMKDEMISNSDTLLNASASSILIENVTGTVIDNAGHINCLGSTPCNFFHFKNVKLKSINNKTEAKGYSCMNVSGTYDDNCSPLPCLARP
jgi:polygalacturonase